MLPEAEDVEIFLCLTCDSNIYDFQRVEGEHLVFLKPLNVPETSIIMEL